RLAAAILEVLAGIRTPTEAAHTVGISLPRYYVLENRAVKSMLVACERRSTGRVRTAESALAALQRECAQLRRECARLQTLRRATSSASARAGCTSYVRMPCKARWTAFGQVWQVVRARRR